MRGPLLRWYGDHARDLPWRAESVAPWGVLVSEVMLQQTPVARVLPVWLAWQQRWPRPADLAAAPSGEAIRHWDRLGYPRRALRLHQAAVAITDRHAGAVPDSFAELLALPGIGDYTAAAVASFAFHQRHAVLDTNVRRVLARHEGGAALPPPSPTRAERERAADLLPRSGPASARWNVALMELGALVCTARAPRCEDCPIRADCRWLALGRPPYAGPARRGQAWAGTDRQVRGLLVAALRSADGPLARAELLAGVPAPAVREPGQVERALAGLVADGLVSLGAGDRVALPG